jgi:hypothetical protein
MTKQLEALIADMKAAAEKSKDLSGISLYTKAIKAKEKFFDIATEENVLALIAALEQAQQTEETLKSRNRRLDGIISAAEKRIAELGEEQKEFAEALGCAGDNESILEAIDGLKTQVREIDMSNSVLQQQLEASPLAVKLPAPSAWRRDSGLFGGFVVTVSGKVAEHWKTDNQSTAPMYTHSDVIEAIRAAGGQVEEE